MQEQVNRLVGVGNQVPIGDATVATTSVLVGSVLRGPGIVINDTTPPVVTDVARKDNVTDDWAKMVERFNKLKPKPYDGKGDMTDAQ